MHEVQRFEFMLALLTYATGPDHSRRSGEKQIRKGLNRAYGHSVDRNLNELKQRKRGIDLTLLAEVEEAKQQRDFLAHRVLIDMAPHMSDPENRTRYAGGFMYEVSPLSRTRHPAER